MPSAACSVARFSAAAIRSAVARLAAAAVAHRPRLRAGAVWTDDDPPERVDARDRAAAGADLDHLDHRNAQRQPAALEKAVDPRHLEGARGLRPRLVDETDLRGRSAHVEGYDLIESVLARDAGGEDRAARGPGFDQSDRKANGGLGGRDPPARGHQQEGTVKAGAQELAGELRKVAPDEGLEIRVGAGGGEALVFAHLRRDLAGQRHCDLRQPARNRIAEAALVIGIGEAVQQPDRHGLDLLGSERIDRPGNAGFVEREEHLALRIDALAHRQAQPARNERRRQVDVDVVLLEAVFVADLDHVAESFGGEKRGSGALALDERIGGERRAMDDHADLAGRDAGLGRDRTQGGEHALFRRVRRGQDLPGKPPLADFQRHVGERAADVDADPDCGGGCHACALKPLSGNDSNVSDASGQSAPRADFISDDAF